MQYLAMGLILPGVVLGLMFPLTASWWVLAVALALVFSGLVVLALDRE